MKKIILMVVFLLMIVGVGCASMKLDFDSSDPKMIERIEKFEKHGEEFEKGRKENSQQSMRTGIKKTVRLNERKLLYRLNHYQQRFNGYVGNKKVIPNDKVRKFETIYLQFLKEEFHNHNIDFIPADEGNSIIEIKMAYGEFLETSAAMCTEWFLKKEGLVRAAVAFPAHEKFFPRAAERLAKRCVERFIENTLLE